MGKSRSEYVAKNATISVLMQFVKNILGFISRTIFIKTLGAEYLGVNGLFTEILTILSFAELGIGNAMVFSLYKPLAENNQEKIKSLMKIYAKSYKIIGFSIAALGMAVIPFLNKIVGDVSYVKENIILLYVLFLLNSVISYFFVYKKSLIIADQKNYIVDIYQQIFYAIQVVVQSIFLIITKQFIVYLLIIILITFLNNFYVARKADKMYPYLKDKNVNPLGKKEISVIINNVKALVVYKIGGIILESTDSIFISSLIDVITVGLYSNYKLIINIFKNIGNQAMNSVIASVGNLNASETAKRKESVFYEMLYITTWFYGFATAGLCCFITPFINIWLGEKYTIGFNAVLAACIYFYISNMHYPCYTYRTTAGLFIFGKYVPMIAAVCNIILDIIMGKKWGLAGILWATTIARIITYELIDPILIYKRIFQKPVIKYFIIYGYFTTLVLVDSIISYKLTSIVAITGFIGIIIKVIVFSIIFNFLYFVVTFRTKQFKSICNRIKIIMFNIKKRRK